MLYNFKLYQTPQEIALSKQSVCIDGNVAFIAPNI